MYGQKRPLPHNPLIIYPVIFLLCLLTLFIGLFVSGMLGILEEYLTTKSIKLIGYSIMFLSTGISIMLSKRFTDNQFSGILSLFLFWNGIFKL